MNELQLKIIETFELDTLSPEQKEEYTEKILELVLDQVIRESMIILNVAENKELQELLKSTDGLKKVEEFLRSKISNFDNLVNYAAARVKNLYDLAKR